ncbi:MAG: porphobilinogen synthase [Bdellovibrionota bacterium]
MQLCHPAFPATRMRRTRLAPWSRSMLRETNLTPSDLIWPVFVIEGQNKTEEISSMPGVFRYSIDRLVKQVQEAKDLGIPAVALFPKMSKDQKDGRGTAALDPENLVCRAIREIKDNVDGIGVLCDVALDPYTSHGHDGILEHGYVNNDATVEVLVGQALNQAKAGCDILGPSDMMDGRVGKIRNALESQGFVNTMIMSYSCKYASSFYGPFREAVGSGALLQGDKKTYQQDPANVLESLREAALDVEEGADMVMVKPGMPYLDVLYRVKQTLGVPTFVYQVSGEYSMICLAIEKGWLSREQAMIESLTSFKRAGADGVLTYFAVEAAKHLQQSS